MNSKGIWLDGVDCSRLAPVRDKWRALVSTVKNILVPQNVENILKVELVASQDGLPSMNVSPSHANNLVW